MKKFFLVTLAMGLLSTVLFTGSVSTAAAKESKILEFDTMIGVPRPYTGATNAIHGVPGGGLPWVVGFAEGELKANGKLEVKVRGLVFDPNDPDVIARGIGGTNTVPNFKAIVSCMSKDADGNPTTVNVSTGLFPADAAGNSEIEETLSLPSPCIAPIIFVTNPGGAWFAATGF
ncbi:MAG: hypothetical protein HZB19_02500 [Chloroflexi bacterium]|nr:hypothetical protein [Chloroflexota bacterium]